MRTDAKKNLKKVATAAIKDPLKTEREIAKETGVSKSSVNRAMQQMGQDGALDRTKAVVTIEETDLEIVMRTQSLNLRWVNDLEASDKLTREDARVLDSIGNTSQKRYSMLSGDATDDKGGLKIETITNYKTDD